MGLPNGRFQQGSSPKLVCTARAAARVGSSGGISRCRSATDSIGISASCPARTTTSPPHRGLGGGDPELCREHAIDRHRRPAPLHVTQDDAACFDACAAFDLGGEQGADTPEADRVGHRRIDLGDDLAPAAGRGSLGGGDDRVSEAELATLENPGGDVLERPGNLGNKDDVGPARHARVQRDPSGVSAHELDDHHAVMAGRGGAKAIDRVGGGGDRGGKPEGHVRPDDVVVDGLGNPDELQIDPTSEAGAAEFRGARHRAVAADDDDAANIVLVERGEDAGRNVAKHDRPVGIDAGGKAERVAFVRRSEDGPAERKDAGDGREFERAEAVFDQPEEAVFDPEDAPTGGEQGFGDGANDRVEPRTITPGRQDRDGAVRHASPAYSDVGDGTRPSLRACNRLGAPRPDASEATDPTSARPTAGWGSSRGARVRESEPSDGRFPCDVDSPFLPC